VTEEENKVKREELKNLVMEKIEEGKERDEILKFIDELENGRLDIFLHDIKKRLESEID